MITNLSIDAWWNTNFLFNLKNAIFTKLLSDLLVVLFFSWMDWILNLFICILIVVTSIYFFCFFIFFFCDWKCLVEKNNAYVICFFRLSFEKLNVFKWWLVIIVLMSWIFFVWRWNIFQNFFVLFLLSYIMALLNLDQAIHQIFLFWIISNHLLIFLFFFFVDLNFLFCYFIEFP